MARARNIKPGFFKNEELAECSPLARLLFAGLWCEADREGRLEDRPRRLKAEYLAYDECNIEDLLGQLESHGFIHRYSVGGERFIVIPRFGRHQNPHVREPASHIPEPTGNSAGTVQAQCRNSESMEPARLIPDSPSLIPDSPSLIPDPAPMGACSLRKRRPPVPVSDIVDLYHRCLPELPRVEKLTKTREGFIRQRWQEDLPDLDHWRNYFDFVRQSDFLMGRSKPTNGRPPFRADIEWITRPNNYAKIAEEKYHGQV